jgi:hypothetical protein
MRIKSDVEFVKRECEGIWMSEMADYCGQEVISYNVDRDGDYVCHFSNGGNWAYPPSCIEGLSTLEKGKKYTINDGINVFEFVEESENFAIFEGGIVFKKEGNTFTEYDPKPEFLKKDWRVDISEKYVDIKCGDFAVAMFSVEGCYMIKGLPERLGLKLDKDGAVKVVK